MGCVHLLAEKGAGVRPCFQFFGVYTQKWDCWIIKDSLFPSEASVGPGPWLSPAWRGLAAGEQGPQSGCGQRCQAPPGTKNNAVSEEPGTSRGRFIWSPSPDFPNEWTR